MPAVVRNPVRETLKRLKKKSREKRNPRARLLPRVRDQFLND
jgi:hypothetical protein